MHHKSGFNKGRNQADWAAARTIILPAWFDHQGKVCFSYKEVYSIKTSSPFAENVSNSAFTETRATLTMITNQIAELKQQIPPFSNPANQITKH